MWPDLTHMVYSFELRTYQQQYQKTKIQFSHKFVRHPKDLVEYLNRNIQIDTETHLFLRSNFDQPLRIPYGNKYINMVMMVEKLVSVQQKSGK